MGKSGLVGSLVLLSVVALAVAACASNGGAQAVSPETQQALRTAAAARALEQAKDPCAMAIQLVKAVDAVASGAPAVPLADEMAARLGIARPSERLALEALLSEVTASRPALALPDAVAEQVRLWQSATRRAAVMVDPDCVL